jgi:putative redox protein
MIERNSTDSTDSTQGSLADYKEQITPVNKATLTWERDLVFHGSTQKGYDIDFDAKVEWGCMPVEALMLSLAGCMAIDVVSILQKMRCELSSFRIDVEGERNLNPPQRYNAIKMLLHLAGKNIGEDQVQRAIALSQEKYCSVYHTLREDLKTTIEYRITKED